MSISDEFIEELLGRTDIVEVIGQYVELKKRGANYVGLCPFHGEKTPSFNVSPVKQFYHCFGCGKSGDAIQFLVEYSGETFTEAVEHLAGKCGLTVPNEQITPQQVEQRTQLKQKKVTILDCLQRASLVYQQQLRINDQAINYLKQRGLDGKTAKKFAIGFAPDEWNFLAKHFNQETNQQLIDAGLLIVNPEKQTNYDRFRGRIMFPIRNVRGETIGFGGRVLGLAEPKYLNSPETPVFSKGQELYGLFEAKNYIQQEKYALVCEGYMDVVALAQSGINNAVATLGTACTGEHIKLLLRFTKNIVFSFDGDKAGRSAAEKAMKTALSLAQDGIKISFLFLPAEHDPDSYVREYGKQAFVKLVQQSLPLSKFLLDYAQNQQDLSISENQAKFLTEIKPLWHALPAGAFKQQILTQIVQLAQLSMQELTELWHINKTNSNKYVNTVKKNDVAVPKLTFGYETRIWQQLSYLLLNYSNYWDSLSSNEQSLLYLAPKPFGDIFVWLSDEILSNGPQKWVILRNKLKSTPFSTTVEKIINDETIIKGIEHNQLENLQALLNSLLVKDIKHQLELLLPQLETDKQARELYRKLQQQYKDLSSKKS